MAGEGWAGEMVKIISAPFHPELEEALVTEVALIKRDSPLHPLAILVPSHQLARRVKWLLAVERRLTLLDVHVLTFHQLSLTLIQEHGVTDLPRLVDGTFREESLRYLVTQQLPDTEAFRPGASIPGMWRALWGSLQDLKEARVDPPAVLTAVQEQLLGKDNQEQFLALLRLYAAVLDRDRQLGIADPDDLAHVALAHVAGSTFLHRLRHLYYYGFYDLTQGQLDFFRAITQSYPATVFFPLHRGNPNYCFAQQFFERYMGGANRGGENGESDASMVGALAEEMRPAVRSECRIYSVVGGEEEVSAAAKEILHLLEDHEMQPHEIGVVVRTLDPLLVTLRRIFTANCIPVSSPMGEMLLQEPLVKTMVKFLTLRANNFPRAAVIDVLTSPFCRRAMLKLPGLTPRPSQWEGITRRLNIAQAQRDGFGDWQRLERAARQGTVSDDSSNGYNRHDSASEQASLLWQLIQQLCADLWALPERASWDAYVTRYLDLLPRWFSLDSWGESEGGTHQEDVEVTLRDSLRAIAALAMLDEEVTLTDWTEHAIRVLERARLAAERRNLLGVQLFDAMDARGLSFRALFVLGLNENIFPRSIQEDAFLRDADREVLSRDLGYKIPRKLDGFDEERLLFALLLRSVHERLYLSYQRADDNGRTMSPSSYLIELQQACAPEVSIRRRPVERWGRWPYEPDLLTPVERAVSLVLNHISGVSACLALRHMPRLFDTCVSAVQAIEHSTTLTSYDGLVGSSLAEVVVSPTALERYARCPFQYFAAQVLRLEPLPEPDCAMQLEARAQGQLYHAILKAFYERVATSSSNLADLRPLEALEILWEEADAAFKLFEEKEIVGYPLLWEVAKDQILALLKDFIVWDLTELRESGYRPRYFEIDLEGILELSSPVPNRVRMHGKIDRIDVREERESLPARIVDYKYVLGNLRADDNNLFVAAARAKRLQPPLYLQLARSIPSQKPLVPECVAFYFIRPKGKDGTNHVALFEAQVCEHDAGKLIQQSLNRIVTGIQEGRFPILPSPDYCGYCDFAAACRVMHDATRRRARADTETTALKALREIKMDIPPAVGQTTNNDD